MVALYRESSDCTKQICFVAMARQMLDRLLDQEARLLTRPRLAKQRDEGRLARACIPSRRLARGRRIAAVVDEVVSDLEGETDVARIAAIGRARFRRQLGHDRSRLHRIFDQRAGLQLLQTGDRGKVEVSA